MLEPSITPEGPDNDDIVLAYLHRAHRLTVHARLAAHREEQSPARVAGAARIALAAEALQDAIDYRVTEGAGPS
jgi:hypothetical protein